MEHRDDNEYPPTHGASFRTTHWSVILAAGQTSGPNAREALEELCQTYWYPLYAWLRRQNHSVADAQDLTQSFLLHLLAGERLLQVHPAKGRFRSFLLASLKNFIANERDRAQALKRGGRLTFLSVDRVHGEARFASEVAGPGRTPDQAFEQSWAMALLDTVLARLRQEYVTEGKGQTFEALQVYLDGDRACAPYAEVAVQLGLSESGVKMAVQRLRRRFGERLRAEILRTVSRPEEVDEEIRSLFAAVSR